MTCNYVVIFWKELKKHTKWIDHTKSMAVSVRTLLAVAFHQYVQRHVEDYSKSCTASVAWLNRPNFDWQAWEITHRHPLQPLFFGLAKQKKHISTARNDKKKNTMELPRKRTKIYPSVPKPHVWCALYRRGFAQMSTSPRAVSGRAGCLCHIMWIRDGHGSKNGGSSGATNPHILKSQWQLSCRDL